MSYVALALGGGILVATLVAVSWSQGGIPFSDQWDEITRADMWNHLFAQHNEHRPAVARLAYLIDKTFFSGSNVFNLTVIVAAQLSCALMLASAVWRDARRTPEGPYWICGLLLGCLFSGYQFENFFWGFQVQFVLVQAFAIAAFLALARGGGTWMAVVLALAFGTLGAYTLASGILILCVLPLLAFALRLRWSQIAVLAAGLVAILSFYLAGYRSPIGHADPLDAINNLRRIALYVPLYLGAPIARLIDFDGIIGPPGTRSFDYTAIAIGLFGCLVTAWYGLQIIRRTKPFTPADFVLIAIMAFVGLTALLTALGRVNFSLQHAPSSRYGSPVLLFWAATLLLAWSARPIAWSWVGRAVPIVATAFLVVLAVREVDVFPIARGWRENQLPAKTALLAGATDFDAFKRVFPNPQHVVDAAPTLRLAGFAPFSEPWAAWRGTPLVRHVPVAPATGCMGWFDEIVPVPAAAASQAGSWRVRGWAWDRGQRVPVEQLVLVDEVGQVVGYAVGGRTPRPDVINNERQITALETGWSGHVFSVKPGKVFAFALIDGGRGACQLSGERAVNAS